MIKRHKVVRSEETNNFYISGDGDYFDGFDENHEPKYCLGHGKPFETKRAAMLQAQMLNDIYSALNQVKS